MQCSIYCKSSKISDSSVLYKVLIHTVEAQIIKEQTDQVLHCLQIHQMLLYENESAGLPSLMWFTCDTCKYVFSLAHTQMNKNHMYPKFFSTKIPESKNSPKFYKHLLKILNFVLFVLVLI